MSKIRTGYIIKPRKTLKAIGSKDKTNYITAAHPISARALGEEVNWDSIP